MRKVIIIFLLLHSIPSMAHQDSYYYACNRNGNVFIYSYAGKGLHNEIKGFGLLYYLEEFNKAYFKNKAYINISLNAKFEYYYRTNFDITKYDVEYCNATFGEHCHYENQEVENVNVVNLNFVGRKISYVDIFKLLYFILSGIDKGSIDIGFRLSDKQTIDSILSLDIYPDFKEILKNRFYNSYFSVEAEHHYIDYFIQNDSFNLYYNKRHTPKRMSDYMDLVSPFNSKNNEKALASFKYFDFMISNDDESSLVVTNDTTFYIYDLPKQELYGPYKMIKPHPYIHQYYVSENRQEFKRVNDSIFTVYGGAFGSGIYPVDVNVMSNYISIDTIEFNAFLKDYLNHYIDDSDSFDREILTNFFSEKKEKNQKRITGVVVFLIAAINTLLLLFFARRSMS